MTTTSAFPHDSTCPCGTGDTYGDCCARWHQGAPAPTVVQLMRARYCAYAIGNMPFVYESWGPRTVPSRASLEADGDAGLTWRKLIIEGSEGGGPFDHEGRVQFTAIARSSTGRIELREDSRFVRENGRWLYFDGTVGSS